MSCGLLNTKDLQASQRRSAVSTNVGRTVYCYFIIVTEIRSKKIFEILKVLNRMLLTIVSDVVFLWLGVFQAN